MLRAGVRECHHRRPSSKNELIDLGNICWEMFSNLVWF